MFENQTGQNGYLPNGNFIFKDDFTASKPDLRWIGVREWRENFIIPAKGGMRLQPYETNIKALAPVSALFYRQQHAGFTAEVTLQYQPKSEKRPSRSDMLSK